MDQSNIQTDIYSFKIDKRLYLEDEKLIKRLYIRLKQSIKDFTHAKSNGASMTYARKCCRKANKLLKSYKTLETIDVVRGLILTAEKNFNFCARNDLVEICKQQRELLEKFSIQLVEDKIRILLDIVNKYLNDKNYHQAIFVYEELSFCYKKLGNLVKTKEMKDNAAICQRKFNHAGAENELQKAEKLRKEGNFNAAIDAADNAKQFFERAGFNEQDEQKCVDFINLCLKEHAEIQVNCIHAGDRLFNLAKNEYNKQEFAEAKRFLAEAKSQFEKGECFDKNDTINAISERCEKFVQAKNKFDIALTYYDKGNYYVSNIYFDIAKQMYEELYSESQDCKNLLDNCDKFLSESKKNYANLMFLNGKRDCSFQNYNSAIVYFEKAMEFGYDKTECKAEINNAKLNQSRLVNETRKSKYYDDDYVDDDDSGYSENDETEENSMQKQQELDDIVAEAKMCIEEGYFDSAREAIKAAEEAGLSIGEAIILNTACNVAEEEAQQADNEDEYGDD